MGPLNQYWKATLPELMLSLEATFASLHVCTRISLKHRQPSSPRRCSGSLFLQLSPSGGDAVDLFYMWLADHPVSYRHIHATSCACSGHASINGLQQAAQEGDHHGVARSYLTRKVVRLLMSLCHSSDELLCWLCRYTTGAYSM